MKTKPFRDKGEWETWWCSSGKSILCYNKVKPLCLPCVLEDLVQLFLGREGSHVEIKIVQIFAKIFVQIRLFNYSKGLLWGFASEIILQNWKNRKCLALIAGYIQCKPNQWSLKRLWQGRKAEFYGSTDVYRRPDKKSHLMQMEEGNCWSPIC